MTQVIIDDVIPRTQLTATAGQTVFNTNWTADASTDIDVYARASGVEPDDATQLVSPSLYNVTFIGGTETVRVTFLSGRTLDDVITIVRNTPATRTNLYINTNFVPSMLNQDFGILTLVDQQAQMYDTVVNPGYNVSATIDTKDKILPILEAQQAWRMNEAGTAIEPYTIDNSPAPTTSPFITYTADATLENPQNLGLLASGLLKNTVAAGIATLARAIPATDYWAPNDVITLPGLPTNPDDAASKAYVDLIALGFQFVNPVNAASTANLTSTYANGVAGVGATLTATALGAFTLDGQAGVLNNRYLMKDQSSSFQNGIYTLTTVGTAGTQAVLTRAADYNEASEIEPGDLVPIISGAVNGNSIYMQTATVTTIGTDPITFVALTPAISNIVTLSGTQTITGDKTFSGTTTHSGATVMSGTNTLSGVSTINNFVFNANQMQHLGDLDNYFEFGTDTQNFVTGNTSRMDLSNSGLRLGGANSRVTTILDEDNMVSDSATALATQQSIKAYVDTKALASFTTIATQTFSVATTTTYTPTAGMKYCDVYVTAGGGGGGGAAAGAAPQAAAAGGGGSGGTSIKYGVTAAAIGASQSITIGDGGAGGVAGANNGSSGNTSSFGAIITTSGGSGGLGAASVSATAAPKNGGAGGAAGSGGSINITGGGGGYGLANGVSTVLNSGNGGPSYWGSGAVGVAASSDGTVGGSYGSGGAGAGATVTTSRAGGKGAVGLIVVVEYI